jgi:hypothetical protein
MHKFLKFILGMKLYMFRTVPLSIIRIFSLYTQQMQIPPHYYFSWIVSFQKQSSLWKSLEQAVSKPLWHIPLLCVQWKTPDDGQRNCPKRVEFQSKNKFEKLVHLVGFIIRNDMYLFNTQSCKAQWTQGSCFRPTSAPVSCGNHTKIHTGWGRLESFWMLQQTIHIMCTAELTKHSFNIS